MGLESIRKGEGIIIHNTGFENAANYSAYDSKEDKLKNEISAEDTVSECIREKKDELEIMGIRMKALESVIDSSGIIVLLRTENGNIKFASAAIGELGYKTEDLTSGKVNFKDLIHPDDADRVILELNENASEGASDLTQTYRIRTKKGHVRMVEENTIFIRDENGNVIYFAGILNDITDDN